VRAEAAADLLDGGSLDVPLPLLHRDAHPRADRVADDERAAGIDAAVADAGGGLDLTEAQLDQQASDPLLQTPANPSCQSIASSRFSRVCRTRRLCCSMSKASPSPIQRETLT
jgi:hypothetical protein